MKDFDSDISATWHVARENESVGLHAVSYCTIQLGLERKGEKHQL